VNKFKEKIQENLCRNTRTTDKLNLIEPKRLMVVHIVYWPCRCIVTVKIMCKRGYKCFDKESEYLFALDLKVSCWGSSTLPFPYIDNNVYSYPLVFLSRI
jgi:hypothetical protein